MCCTECSSKNSISWHQLVLIPDFPACLLPLTFAGGSHTHVSLDWVCHAREQRALILSERNMEGLGSLGSFLKSLIGSHWEHTPKSSHFGTYTSMSNVLKSHHTKKKKK